LSAAQVECTVKEWCIIICLGTSYHANISDHMLKIDSYSFERKDRKGKNGGGLIVYLSNNVIYKRRHDLENQ